MSISLHNEKIDFSGLHVGNFRDRPSFEQMYDYAKAGFIEHYRTIGDPDEIDRHAALCALLDVASIICANDAKLMLIGQQLEIIGPLLKPN